MASNVPEERIDERVPAGTHTDPAIDVAEAWRRLADTGRLSCWSPDDDRAFWRARASDYGDRFTNEHEGLEALRRAASASESVLEIGPGTGRYTAEVAPLVDHVTTVDYSAAMGQQLRATLEDRNIENVDHVSGRWPEVDVDSHDVVFTAWTMYSQRDIRAALEALVAVTTQTLLIVDSTGVSPPHSRLITEIRDEEPTPRVPRYRYLAGALEELGVHADVSIEPAVREFVGETPDAIATQVVPPETDDRIVRTLADRLESTTHLESVDGEWRYRYEIPAGVICWQRGSVGNSL